MILGHGFEQECNGGTGAVLLSRAVHDNHPTPHPRPGFIDLRAQTYSLGALVYSCQLKSSFS